MSAMCPNCGYDLVADDPMTIGALEFDPRGDVKWHGQPVHLSENERIVLHTLAKAAGRIVPRSTILDRLDSTAETNVLGCYLYAIRRKFAALGEVAPIESLYGVGWRWSA